MRVNEIFYSLQGEGYHTGTAAIFIRLAGCNLKCPFCDTDHQPYQDLTEDDITQEVAKYDANLVVITGGEPTLQLTTTLIDKIHELGKVVAIETNGTRPTPFGVDWVTVSPKDLYTNSQTTISRCDEVKVIVTDRIHQGILESTAKSIKANHYFLQPCDTGDMIKNSDIIAYAVRLVKENPLWRMSLQAQKYIHVR